MESVEKEKAALISGIETDARAEEEKFIKWINQILSINIEEFVIQKSQNLEKININILHESI